jgi:uncharacterized protein YbgA (DUF1722 family)/uncharacterized protein YbbK (DUF523 family)
LVVKPAQESRIPRIRVGISACLLGAKVRFDGQHKRDAFLVDELGPLVEWVSVCPEVEVGMGVPRESVRLVRVRDGARDGAGPRMVGMVGMVGLTSGADWTARMRRFAAARVARLAREDLSGFVLKSKSPSCGMERVKVYADAEARTPLPDRAAGLFAEALMRAFPNLPVEEEGRLADARLRENFVERIFAYARLRELWRGRWTLGALVAFHAAHKMALLAHSTEGYRALGRLVAQAKALGRAELRARYEEGFMATLRKPTTPGRHANVLMHLLGHLKDQLDPADKAELLALIDEHRHGHLPLVVPLTLLAHHARRHRAGYLLAQTYLAPRVEELRLRNRP